MAFDYSEFKELRNKVAGLEQRSDEFFREFLLDMALRAQGRIKKRQEGRMGKSFKAVDTGTMVNAWMLSEVRRSGDTLIVEIFNNVEYASHVEYGHRTRSGGFVEGKFMCKFTLDEIERELPARLETEFKRFVSTLGL